MRLLRILALGTGLWIVINLSQTWGEQGAFTYPEAHWNGRTFVETGPG